MRAAAAPLLLFPFTLVAGASIGSKDHDDALRQLNVPFLNGFYNPNGGNPLDVATDLYVSYHQSSDI